MNSQRLKSVHYKQSTIKKCYIMNSHLLIKVSHYEQSTINDFQRKICHIIMPHIKETTPVMVGTSSGLLDKVDK